MNLLVMQLLVASTPFSPITRYLRLSSSSAGILFHSRLVVNKTVLYNNPVVSADSVSRGAFGPSPRITVSSVLV
jgi:hypothetical protein